MSGSFASLCLLLRVAADTQKTYCKFSLLLVSKFLIWQNSIFLEDLPFFVLVWVFLFSRLFSYAGVRWSPYTLLSISLLFGSVAGINKCF